ncbi:restriction endonuclease subunit S [Shewanella sp. MF05960]|uniref:restriction endonuclease subunit S n=1 Tax=Shewanella sp. MF05960 TaxID=3434874 RepID=UPI003D793ADD
MADLSTPTNDGQSEQTAESLITQHIDIWTTAIEQKSSAGRGTSNKFSLYGIKKLRELILELAVRGKLVPQDANDEPASVLLERIAAEKAQLVKDKKIKKPKALPEIGEDEKPFELTLGWQCVRLGSIGNIFNGNSVNARLKEDKYTGLSEGLPFIATKDVGYGFETLDYKNGVLIPFDEPKFKVAQKNSVLICAEGGSAGKKCGIALQDICFGNKLFAIELYGDIEPKFVLSTYLTPSFFQQFSESMTGIIGGISAAKFSEMLIALPPLEEQHRIVAKVEELMSLCDALETQTEASISAHQTLVETLLNALLLPNTSQAADSQSASLEPSFADSLEHSLNESFIESWQRVAEHFDTLFTTEASIDTLKQTILQLAVMGKLVPQDENDEPAAKLLERIAAEKTQLIKDGKIKKQKPLPAITDEEKPFELPEGWEWEKCQDICHKITDGEHATPERTDSGHYLLSARNVTNEGIVLNDVDFVPTHEFNRIRNRCDPNIGDILISCSGSVGRVALVDRDDAYSMVRSAAMIRPCNNNLSPLFLALMLRSPYLQRQMKARSKQSAQANLFLGAIANLVAIIPPLEEQHRIVAKVDELMALCDHLKARLSAAQTTQLHLTDAIVEQAI